MDVWLDVVVHICNATFGLMRQEDYQYSETSLPYKVRPCLRDAEEGGGGGGRVEEGGGREA